MKHVENKTMDVLHRITLPKEALKAIGAEKDSFIGISYKKGYVELAMTDNCNCIALIDKLGRIHINKMMCMVMMLEDKDEICVYTHDGSIIICKHIQNAA